MPFTKEEFELIKTLTDIDGISGYEKEVARFLKEEYLGLGCSLIFDNLGGLFALKKSNNPNAFNVMIDAHMDEVGFLVGEIKDDGKIHLLPVGGLYPEKIINAPLRLRNNEGDIFKGYFETNDKKDELIFVSDFKDRKSIFSAGINYGDVVTFDTIIKQIGENRYLSKAYDDRYGLALGIEILRHFKDKELPFNLYVGGSVQEEVGLRGATLNLDAIKPDLAIVLDCSSASINDEGFGILGNGLLIRFFDRGMVAFKELLDLQVEAAISSNAKYQYFTTLGGTNAGNIHKYGNGILTLTHCVCGKNIHTHEIEFDSSDYQNAKKSLIYLLDNLSSDKMKQLKGVRRWK